MNKEDRKRLRHILKKKIGLTLDDLSSIYLSNGFSREDFREDLKKEIL